MKVTVIPIIIRKLKQSQRIWIRDSRNWKTDEELKWSWLNLTSVRILRRVLGSKRDIQSLRLQWKSPVTIGVKNSPSEKEEEIIKIIMIIIKVTLKFVKIIILEIIKYFRFTCLNQIYINLNFKNFKNFKTDKLLCIYTLTHISQKTQMK